MTPGVVCLDVNPGEEFARGELGVAELVDTDVTASFLLRPGDALAPVWPWLEAFVADRPVVAYGADYDRTTLYRLLTGEGLPVPPWVFYDAWRGMVRLRPHGYADLQSTARDLGLFSPAELLALRARARAAPMGKWLLATAEDDAVALARLVRWLCVTTGQGLAKVLAGMPSRRLA